MVEEKDSSKDSPESLGQPGKDSPENVGGQPEKDSKDGGQPGADNLPKPGEDKVPTVEELQAQLVQKDEDFKSLQSNRDKKDVELKEVQSKVDDLVYKITEAEKVKEDTPILNDEDILKLQSGDISEVGQVLTKMVQSGVKSELQPFIQEREQEKVQRLESTVNAYVEKRKDSGMTKEKFAEFQTKLLNINTPEDFIDIVDAMDIKARLPEVATKLVENKAAEVERKKRELAAGTVTTGQPGGKGTVSKTEAEKLKEGQRKFYSKVVT